MILHSMKGLLAKMIYSWISKEMSSLYFGLDVFCRFQARARILKHFKVTAEKKAFGKVNFSNGILKQPDFSLTAVCHCDQETYSLASGLNAAVLVTLLVKIACVFKNPKNAGMVGKISYQAKSYLFNHHEMFKNSGSEF